MGQLDQTVQVTLRNRINTALSTAESEDANSVESQTLRLIKCAMDDRDVIARSRGECSGCDNEVILELLETMVSQRERAIKQFDDNGRIAEAERERTVLLAEARREAERSIGFSKVMREYTRQSPRA